MSKTRFTTYVESETLEKIKHLSGLTRVPVARYIQEALEDLLKKYESND